jgi:hypothetical protein
VIETDRDHEGGIRPRGGMPDQRIVGHRDARGDGRRLVLVVEEVASG